MTKLVGILNITPDSFSDGGKYLSLKPALEKLEQMILEGADVIDIGAQSTRPGASILNHEQEWQRLEPLLEIIRKNKYNVEISIDSFIPQTILKALEYDVDIINDVKGLSSAEMIAIASKSQKKVIFMHSLSVPADKNINLPENSDVNKTLILWLKEKIFELETAGIKKSNMIFDPGIGFGKTPSQCFEIVRNAEKFKEFGVDVLIGHSEKSFLNLITDKPAGQRGAETLAISFLLAKKNIDYLRIHDVAGNKRIIEIAKGL